MIPRVQQNQAGVGIAATKPNGGVTGSFRDALEAAKSNVTVGIVPLGEPNSTETRTGGTLPAASQGFVTLGYSGQNPPEYPPGYPPVLQNQMNQILENPNISMATKSRTWTLSVTGAFARSEFGAGGNLATSYSNYNDPSFSPAKFWQGLISATAAAGSAYADVNAALKTVSA